MRKELLGSVLVHVGVLGTALLWLGLPEPDDAPSMGSMQVELIAMASVSTNTSEVIASDATEDLVSAGAEQAIPETSEPVDAGVPETVTPQTNSVVEPVKTEPFRPVEIQPAAPVEPTAPVETPDPIAPEPVTSEVVESDSQSIEAPLLLAAPEAITPEVSVAPGEQEAPLEPVETTEFTAAPVPHTLSFTRPTAPTPPPRTPKPPAPPQRTATSKAQQAGSVGNSNTDAAAATSAGGQSGTGSGGSADVARYPGQVQNKLRRALRYPRAARGDSGEAHVYFVVDSGGQVLNLRVARSSGNPIIDQAALDTVRKAAPFPPIPNNAGRTSWDFTIPLAFRM
ncbi:energy transducer TonB family protein [Devosia limi]|uniref:Protein TonB n=1 Tax=Devosia limi DSM 17137 TaxID=1121477 RepID=A0A1M4Y9A0_9HYPH|nr:TonB family protein [Devosia limi]SHF02437.1 protein TonB [Devosia limi DSM 17137]